MEPASPRWLLAVELVGLAVCLTTPLPVPAVLPLLVLAGVSVAVRRATFLALPAAHAPQAIAIGALAGLVALGIGVTVATPLLAAGLGAVASWRSAPPIGGSLEQLVAAVLVVGAMAAAHELVFRRWVIERAWSLGASGSGAILAAAALEAAALPGGLVARMGAACFAVGLGLLYWRGGRRVGPAVAARLAFGWGALLVEALGA